MDLDKQTFFSLIIIVFVLLGLLIFIGSQLAPYFTYYLLLCALLVLWYASTEKLIFHDAAEFENRFWTLLSFIFAYVLIFVSDSPFRLHLSSSISTIQPKTFSLSLIPWMIVIAFTFLAHNYNRHRHRLSLTKTTTLQHSRDKRKPLPIVFHDLYHCIQSIDNPWIASYVTSIFFLPKILYVEQKILSMFDEASAFDLNNAFPNIELGLIFYKIKDHLYSPSMNHRTKLIRLLCITRINDLNIQSKALLLDALMRLKISAVMDGEKFVRNVLLKTNRDDLSELKGLIDSKGDINSMHKLIFEDIRNLTIQEQILSHIRKQANEQLAHSIIKTKAGKRSAKFAWKKILSDVDDTLYCSGGSYPAGVDITFPRKVIYPGALAFYRELDLGWNNNEDNEWNDKIHQLGNLVFLSARPHVYKDIMESPTFDSFMKLQQMGELHTRPSLLAGSLDTGTEYVIKNDLEPLASKKYSNYKEYSKIYPEYKSIFIGDNGQGDVRAAEMVFHDHELVVSSSLERVYIHIVKPLANTYLKDDRMKQDSKIYFFGNYIDAAIDALEHKLINTFGLLRLMREAKQDFIKIDIKEWKKKAKTIQAHQLAELKRDKKLRELNASLVRGNEILRLHHLPVVSTIRIDALYFIGQAVNTCFGMGVVIGFRSHDGVYKVELQWDTSGRSSPTIGFFVASQLQPVSYLCLNPICNISFSKYLEVTNYENHSTIWKRRRNSSISHSHSLTHGQQSSRSGLSGSPLRETTSTNITISKDDLLVANTLLQELPIQLSYQLKCGLKTFTLSLPTTNQSLPVIAKSKDQKLHSIIGALCWTPYGRAYLVDHRTSDDIIVVTYLGKTSKGSHGSCFGFLKKQQVIILTDPMNTAIHTYQQSLLKKYHTFFQKERTKSIFSDLRAESTTFPELKAERTTFPEMKAERTTFPEMKAERTTFPELKAETVPFSFSSWLTFSKTKKISVLHLESENELIEHLSVEANEEMDLLEVQQVLETLIVKIVESAKE